MTPSSCYCRSVWVLRSGGLGDFLLTVPFLKALRQRAETFTVVTRRSYGALVADDLPGTRWMDMDGSLSASLFGRPRPEIRDALHGSQVFSFIGEGDPTFRANLDEAGCTGVTFLKSRPAEPPHVTLQMFRSAGIDPPPDLCEQAWLGRRCSAGRTLWVHPGSGSPAKNAPLESFRARVSAAMKEQEDRQVHVLLGEAEQGMRGPVVQALSAWRPQFTVEPPLKRLREMLEASADGFIGNDSGVSHLAAMLGVPTDVFFISTSPEIWRPLGPAVNVLR